MRRNIALITVATALLATGCSQSRFGGSELAARPANLTPAPTSSVQTGALPPAVASGPGNIQPVGPNGTPGVFPGDQAGTQIASADPNAPTSAPDRGLPVSENALIGNWTTSVAGSNCATFFGLTNLGSGLLGGTRGCPGTLSKFRTWKVAGNTATLRDSTGATVATLRRTGDKTFSGTTASGEAFTLTR